MKKTLFFSLIVMIGLCLGPPLATAVDYPSQPAPSIHLPIDGDTYPLGAPVVFSGSLDRKGSLVWTSTQDGIIGDGNYFVRDDLSVGHHYITLTASYQEGGATLYGTMTVNLNIAGPAPEITSPNDKGVFPAGYPISFNGYVNDDAFQLIWYSDRDQELGTGPNLTLSTLTPGQHVITLMAQSVVGDKVFTGSTQITITVTGYSHTSQYAGSEWATFDLWTKILYIPYLDVQYPVLETAMWMEMRQTGLEDVTVYTTTYDENGVPSETSSTVKKVLYQLVGYGVQPAMGNRELYAVFHMLNRTLYLPFVDVDGKFYAVEMRYVFNEKEDSGEPLPYPLKFYISDSYLVSSTNPFLF